MFIHRSGRRTAHAVHNTVKQYNPDSLDNNLCDKRILAITNLETENKTNKPKKMFCTILLELLLPFRPFKETANIRWTTISAQIVPGRIKVGR